MYICFREDEILDPSFLLKTIYFNLDMKIYIAKFGAKIENPHRLF